MEDEKFKLNDQQIPEEADSVIDMTGQVEAPEPNASDGKNNSLSWFSMPKASTVAYCVIYSACLVLVYIWFRKNSPDID